MKLLIFDTDRCGLAFALHAQEWGHDVRLWMPPMAGTWKRSRIGEGMIERPLHWEGSIRWADFVFCTDNSRFREDLTPWQRRGFPILGATPPQADLELDREKGICLLQECGLETLPYEVFSNWKAAIDYVKTTNEVYVSKPWGGNPDKSLSYVSCSPADMVFKLEKWAEGGAMKGKILLQKAVKGIEMAVGVWLHRFGPCAMVNENWEEKKLMNDGLGVNCYSEDTEVLTEHGWRTFDKVTLDDAVASYQPADDSIFFEKPVRLHWADYEGDMISFENRYVDLLVTPTHQMWANRRKTENWRFYAAQDCPSEFDVKQSAITKNRDILCVDISMEEGKETFVGADRWFEFLGLYLSEGFVDDRLRVHICQCPGVKKDCMRAILRSLPWEFYEYEKVFSITHEPELGKLLKLFGLSHEKFVPDSVKYASARQIKLFLETFCLGDGDYHDGKKRYHSGSYQLISDIQELLLRVGIAGVIYTDKRTTMVSPLNGKTYAAQPVYSIEETTRKKTSIMKRERVHYKGKIGCVTLPTTHLLFVRRKQRVVISGNTGEAGTITRYVEKSQLYDDLLAPCVGRLIEMGYRGYVDFNTIIEKDGTPHFLEATVRPGWPHFNLHLALQQGDPVAPLAALLEGKDEFRYSSSTCVGVVMTHGDFPYGNFPPERVEGFPIVGLPSAGTKSVWLTSAMCAEAPVMFEGRVKTAETVCTAGDYVCIVTGLGPTVEAARRAAYSTAWKINWPSNRMMRTDIGCRLEKEIPLLQRHGYATELSYGK